VIGFGVHEIQCGNDNQYLSSSFRSSGYLRSAEGLAVFSFLLRKFAGKSFFDM
jgi:hypothetical protein